MNGFKKTGYALTAAVIISLLLTTSLTQNANANPGPAATVSPTVTTSGGVVHAAFTSVVSIPTIPALHHYNFHAHFIAYRDAPQGTFSIDPTNFADCKDKALSPLSRVLVTDGTNGVSYGGTAVPAGAMVHVTFDNATTDFIALQIDSGASFKLVDNPGITLYFDTAGGPNPIDPATILVGAGGPAAGPGLDVHWQQATGTLREDTTGPGVGTVFLCTFQDVDYVNGPVIGDLAGGADDPPTGADSYDVSTATFTKLAGRIVGGEILPIDMTSLFVAGAMTNAFWILPAVGSVVAGITMFKVRRKQF